MSRDLPTPRAELLLTSVKITTVGNSLGIVLPRELLQKLRVGKGDHLHLIEAETGVLMLPSDPRLLAQIESLERLMRTDRELIAGIGARDAARVANVGAAAPPALTRRGSSGG